MEHQEDFLFQNNSVRRVWHNDEWWFSVEDVVSTLTDSPNIKSYIHEMLKRDVELNNEYERHIYALEVKKNNNLWKIDCANIEGIFRIIQSIFSPKAEPFKLWLAKLGKKRIYKLAGGIVDSDEEEHRI